jgi:hypothetical protein
MRTLSRLFTCLLLATALAVPAMVGGCAARVSGGYRYYDPGYNDYHSWNNNEVVFYSQWESDTHRDHRDFKKRNSDEQKEYWKWRHDHDHDHDHDNDRH